MTHCSGGPSTDAISLFLDLVDWVENDKAPASPVVAVRADNPEVPEGWSRTRSRPLCAPTEVARYDGRGDLKSASSFRCEWAGLEGGLRAVRARGSAPAGSDRDQQLFARLQPLMQSSA